MTTEMLVNYFWPTRFNQNVTLMVRVGRVLHWAAASLGLYMLVWGMARAMDTADRVHPNMTAYLGATLLFCLVGRGARYILAQE